MNKGAKNLLTDPQIITSRALEEDNGGQQIFAAGNTNFKNFEAEHACNEYCERFIADQWITTEEHLQVAAQKTGSAILWGATRNPPENIDSLDIDMDC
jgi:hypothetical protein